VTRPVPPEPTQPPHVRVDPPSLAPPKGYAHAVLASPGRTLHLAGQVGWDREGRFPTGLVAQVDRTLENLLVVLAAAGGRPEHVVSMRVYVRSVSDWRRESRAIGEVWRARMGRWFPAMALVEVARLYEPDAVVEIEGVAVLPDGR
jgi:enamine deaminase RidA (YjgF/YER057c/UK114 family)